jgi:hypothetical protein
VSWDGVKDEFPYATGWACAASGTISVVLGPAAKACKCFEGYSGHVDLHLPMGPGARIVARVPIQTEISAHLDLQRGSVLFDAEGTATLDADVGLELGAHVRGTAAFTHEEESDDARPVVTSGSGSFDAVVCEERPGALADLLRWEGAATKGPVQATIATRKIPLVTALARVEHSASGSDTVSSIKLFSGSRSCETLARVEKDAYVDVLVQRDPRLLVGRRHPMRITYWTPVAGPYHPKLAGRSLQVFGVLALDAIDLSPNGRIAGTLYGRGTDADPGANGVAGSFTARVCRSSR